MHLPFIPVAGPLTLGFGDTLHINTTEPSAIVVDNQGNKKNLIILAETNHSFTNDLSISREWKYSIARLVFINDIILNSNSIVNISGENALSIEALEGNIVVNTTINLSCAVTVLGGKCVGGYMAINKPLNLYSPIIPGKPSLSNDFIPFADNLLTYPLWAQLCIKLCIKINFPRTKLRV